MNHSEMLEHLRSILIPENLETRANLKWDCGYDDAESSLIITCKDENSSVMSVYKLDISYMS